MYTLEIWYKKYGFYDFYIPFEFAKYITLVYHKGKRNYTIQKDTGQTFVVACIYRVGLLDGWGRNWLKYQIILTFALIRFRLTLAYLVFSAEKYTNFYTWCESNTKRRKSLLYVIAQVWKVKVDSVTGTRYQCVICVFKCSMIPGIVIIY